MLTKTELRNILAAERAKIPARKEKQARLTQNALKALDELRPRSVFCYVSFGSEADTHEILKKLLVSCKVYVPFTHDGIMKMQLLSADDRLEADKQGNIHKKNPVIYSKNVDLIIVPMLGFNEGNYRIGYGGGYYDRFLSVGGGVSLGLAFDEQAVEFCAERFDVPLDKIVTPTRILRRKNG